MPPSACRDLSRYSFYPVRFAAKTLPPVQSSPLSADIETVPGVGPRRSAALRGRQIATLADVLMHLPHRYDDLRRRDDVATLQAGMNAVLEGVLQNVTDRPMPGRWSRRLATAFLRQASGKGIRVVWFNLRGGSLPAGEPLVLSGRVTSAPNGTLELVHPEIYRLRNGAATAIGPIYSLPAEIPQRLFASIVAQALHHGTHAELDAVPPELRRRENLSGVIEALAYLHQPPPGANI